MIQDTARQKLFTLGLSEEQIAALPSQPVASLRRQELRSPIAGRIAERRVDLGALVGREGQESELYVVVDLSELWLDLAVPLADLPAIREGQEITVVIGAGGKRVPARIIFVSPLLDRETRAARVVATLANPDQAFRPGSFVIISGNKPHYNLLLAKGRATRRALSKNSCATGLIVHWGV